MSGDSVKSPGGAGCPFTNGDYQSFVAAMQRAISVTPTQIHIWSEELIARHNWGSVVDRILAALAQSRGNFVAISFIRS